MSVQEPPQSPASIADRPCRVTLLGFGEFERHALSTFIKLSRHRVPSYEQVEDLSFADFIVADAEHPGAVDEIKAAGRGGDTVFIGSLAPEGALAWAMRPIDPMQVFRELDGAAAMRMFRHVPPPPRHAASAAMPLESLAPPAAMPPLPPLEDDDAPQAARDPAPAAAVAPEPDAEAPQRRAGDVAAAPLALLVDDSEIALRFLQRHVEALGLRTETCRDSQGAMALLDRQRFDAVFVDLDLGPDSAMNGFSLCQQVKRKRPQGTGLPPRVVIVSAHGSPTDRVRGAFVGCDAYLTKPLAEETLAQTLRTLGLLAAPQAERPRRSSRHREAAARREAAMVDVPLDDLEPVSGPASADEAAPAEAPRF